MTVTDSPAIFYCDHDMEHGEIHEVASGRAAAFTARRPGKEGPNEDAALVVPLSDQCGVLAVADGFGGHPAGHQASRITLEALNDCLQRGMSNNLELRESILNGFELANQNVTALGIGAATTLSVVEIRDGIIRPYHAGDSLILVVGQRGKVKLQTISHSPVGYAVEAGFLEEREAMEHEDRHLVSNMIGSAEMRIEIGPELRLCPRDTVLLASDGLSDNLHVEEIVARIRKGPLGKGMAALAGLCATRILEPREGFPSKPDDLTFIAYRTALS